MVSHQVVTEDKNLITEELTDKNLEFGNIYDYQLRFTSSMVAHQLPFLETPADFLISTAAHGCSSNIYQGNDFESSSGLVTSSFAHYQSIEPVNVDSVLLNQQEYFDSEILNTELDFFRRNCNRKQSLDPSIGVEVCDPTQFHEDTLFIAELAEPVVLSSTINKEATNISIRDSDDDDMPKCLITQERFPQYDELTTSVEISSTKEDPECVIIPEINFNTLKSIQEDHIDKIHSAHISMVTHQLPVFDIPTEFSEFLISTAAHRCSVYRESDYFIESSLDNSMVAHQSKDIRKENEVE